MVTLKGMEDLKWRERIEPRRMAEYLYIYVCADRGMLISGMRGELGTVKTPLGYAQKKMRKRGLIYTRQSLLDARTGYIVMTDRGERQFEYMKEVLRECTSPGHEEALRSIYSLPHGRKGKRRQVLERLVDIIERELELDCPHARNYR